MFAKCIHIALCSYKRSIYTLLQRRELSPVCLHNMSIFGATLHLGTMCLQNVFTFGAICLTNQGTCAKIIAHNVFILSSSTISAPLYLYNGINHYCQNSTISTGQNLTISVVLKKLIFNSFDQYLTTTTLQCKYDHFNWSKFDLFDHFDRSKYFHRILPSCNLSV